MPLLMVDPDRAAPAPTSAIDIEPGSAACIAFDVGQLLTIETLDAGQVAALYAFRASDSTEFLSPHHTRVFGGSFHLRMGMRMVTNRRRPMFVVGRDSLRIHDLLLPASEATSAAIAAALDAAGESVTRIPDPVNLFADVRLAADGRLDPRPSPSRAGERVTVRALMKGLAVVACAEMTLAAMRTPAGRVRVATHNDVRDLPADLALEARP